MKMTERLAYQRRLCQVPTNMTREDFHVAAVSTSNSKGNEGTIVANESTVEI